MRVLVTGTAGFIGNHLAIRLLDRGDEVIGVDNVNDYYDVRLKEARLARIEDYSNFTEIRAGIHDRSAMEDVFAQYKPQRVVNLAAQAGVRYSLQNPYAYVDSNLLGFVNILEGCRHHDVEHLVYASSSSVYGANTRMPFSVHHNVDHPISLYAASKKANELMAHTYSHLFGLPTTGLRFFTVYGPWGRPDMALFLFAKAILEGRAIDVFNHGDMQRDFTYIDDAVTPAEALAILSAQEPGRKARIATLEVEGLPAYTTSAGWLGYDDEKVARLSRESVAEGFTMLKLKVGADLNSDIRRLRVARDAAGTDNAKDVLDRVRGRHRGAMSYGIRNRGPRASRPADV